MYQLEWIQQRVASRSRGKSARLRISATVWYLGFTSCLTDISSEMVNGVLPLYVVGFLRLSPLQFGLIDGLYQGVSAVLRIAGGLVADRWRRYKETAAAGYALSAVCKLGLLLTGRSWVALAGVIALDRTGKGLRTAPRDALITLNSDRPALGTSFGVHRALDAGGALLGPVVAFFILAYVPNGFDVVFVVSFSIAIVGLGVLVLFVDGTKISARGSTDGQALVTLAALGALLRPYGFGYLVLAASALSLTTVSDAFIYLTLQQRLAFAPSVFPLLYVATSLVYVVGAVPAGWLADRVGRRLVFLGGYLSLGLVYVMLLLPSSGATGAAAGIMALGLYYAATDGVLMAIAGRMLPPASCATGLALLSTCTSVSRFLSSLAFGWIWTAGDVATAVRVFGAALGAAVLIAAIALSRVHEGAPAHESQV